MSAREQISTLATTIAQRAGEILALVGGTAPAPEPTPVPEPAPKPEPGPMPSGVFFADRFDSDDLSYTENGVRWTASNGSNNGQFAPFVLDRVLRCPMRGTFPSDAWSEQRWAMQPIGKILVGYDLLVPPSYVIPAVRPDNNKMLRLWKGDYRIQTDHYGWSFVRRSDGGIAIRVEGPVKFPNTPRATGPLATLGNVPQNDGQFHRHEMLVDVAAQRMQFRIDGALLWEGGPAASAGADLALAFNAGHVGGWANSGFQRETYVEFDNVVLAAG